MFFREIELYRKNFCFYAFSLIDVLLMLPHTNAVTMRTRRALLSAQLSRGGSIFVLEKDSPNEPVHHSANEKAQAARRPCATIARALSGHQSVLLSVIFGIVRLSIVASRVSDTFLTTKPQAGDVIVVIAFADVFSADCATTDAGARVFRRPKRRLGYVKVTHLVQPSFLSGGAEAYASASSLSSLECVVRGSNTGPFIRNVA